MMFWVDCYLFDYQCVSFLRCSALSLSKNGTVSFYKKEQRDFFQFFFENQKIGTPFLLQMNEGIIGLTSL